MKLLHSFILSTFIRAALGVAVSVPTLQARQSSPIRFFVTSANQALNGARVTTNGTHLGIRPSSSAVVQATTSPGGRANTNILTVSPANGNVLALVGPPNTLAFVEVSNPPPPPPSGIIVEWEWWRLFPTPDPRVRMADMTASIWIAVPDGGSGDWLLTWFKGDIDPSMTTVTLFWEPVPV